MPRCKARSKNWLGYTLSKSDDRIAKQAQQWTLQDHRRQKHLEKRSGKNVKNITGFGCSWKKTDATQLDKGKGKRGFV